MAKKFLHCSKNGGKMVEVWSSVRSIDSRARDMGWPWTWWIVPHQCRWAGVVWAPRCHDLRDGLLAGVGCSSLTLRYSWTVTLIILGLGFLRARVLRLCCTTAFPPIFLQLRKGPLWSCAELLQSYALCQDERVPKAITTLFLQEW